MATDIETQVPIRKDKNLWIQRIFTYNIDEDGNRSVRPIKKEEIELTDAEALKFFQKNPQFGLGEIEFKTNDIYTSFYSLKPGVEKPTGPQDFEITPANGAMMNKFFQVPAVMAFVSSGQFLIASKNTIGNMKIMVDLCAVSDPRPESVTPTIPILSGAPLTNLQKLLAANLAKLDELPQ